MLFFFANMSKLQFLFVQHKKDMAFGLLSHGCLTYNSLDYCTIVMGLSFWWFTFDILSFSFSHFSLKFHVNVMSWCSKKYSSLTQLLWNTPLARYTSSSALFLPPTFPLFLSMTDSNTARYCRSRTPTHDNQRLSCWANTIVAALFLQLSPPVSPPPWFISICISSCVNSRLSVQPFPVPVLYPSFPRLLTCS